MAELFLTFTGDDGKPQRVKADGERFSVGRHSDNELVIRDSRLSRFHLQIERFADVFVASDMGSSNGTKLNGEELSDPQGLSDGDELDLGGFPVRVELVSGSGEPETGKEKESVREPAPAAAPPLAAAEPEAPVLGKLFIIAPIAAFLLLVLVGGGILVYSLAGGDDDRDDSFPTPYEDLTYSTPDSTDPGPGPTPDLTGTPQNGADTTPESSPPEGMAEEEKLRNLVTDFMRGIAQRDPSPVITSEPLSLIKARTDGFRGNSAVASNLENAARSKEKIIELARSKNLRPDFVAGAALAKLGGSRGDVAATAAGMVDVLSQLKIQIGDAFANECIIIIGAYDQGERGQFLEMRDTMTKLATDNPGISSRKVRTAWFLRERGKLSDSQFELVLRFLALGAISRDPKSFGISADPLRFG